MDNPDRYILVSEGDDLEDGVDVFSNLDWGKEQACKQTETRQLGQTIYKLVPVFETSLEITKKVVTKDL